MSSAPGPRRDLLVVARQGVDLLVTLSAWVGGLGLAAGLGVVLYDVIARAFGHPLSGSPDIVQMCFVVIVFGCVPLCERTAGNVRLDLLETLFPPALNRVFDLIATALGAALFVLIGWKCWEAAQISRMLNLGTNVLRIPKAPFQIAITLASGIAALSMVLHLIEIALGRAQSPAAQQEPAT
ncbi:MULTISPECIES: TRAP transporter small permease [Rhodobacterales]|uniref:TRAP transporter small permease n=1 Tax=Rhodobacterales TaxID=204455 RepID=UPI001CD27E7D|nr:TRAP transporter small permease [Salipiger thiooxidans]MCA0849463.1 TRAP transporter small permease [Salipiger thiooxidans]